MRLRDLLGWTARLLRGQVELGRVHLACGEPVQMDLESDVHEVSRQVVAELQRATAITTHHLRAFLARTPLPGVDLPWLVEALERRGGRVLEVPHRSRPLPDAVERCMREQFLFRFHPEAALAFAGDPAVEAHLRANAWAPAHGLDPEAELADPRVRAVVEALFGPVAADHAAVEALLARRRAAGEPPPEPREATRVLPGAHRPDVEDAFEALLARGVLVRERASGRLAWGPHAPAPSGSGR